MPLIKQPIALERMRCMALVIAKPNLTEGAGASGRPYVGQPLNLRASTFVSRVYMDSALIANYTRRRTHYELENKKFKGKRDKRRL